MKRISLVIFLLAILAAVINCAENVTFNAADFNTIVHDKTFLDLSEALQDKFIRHLLKTPTLVFVAGQSFGKSLFIALRAAFPITFSASNIGTRCPVKYIFRNSVDVGFEGVKVNGKIVANEEVMDAVQSHMEALKKDNKFSNEELVVEVSFPDIQNAIYIDLPGAPDITAPHYDAVVEMIRSAVSSPETIIVALMDAGKVDPVSSLMQYSFIHVSYFDSSLVNMFQASHDSRILEAILGGVRPNWRNEMVLLKNHVNIAMLQMHKVEEVNNYFDPAYNVGEVYHLMLNPTVDKGGLDDRKDIASKAQWVRDVKHHLEQDLFDEHIARIEAKEGRPVKSSIRDRTGIKFGLNVTINALDKKMQEKTLAMLPQLAVDVNKIIAEREERLNELKAIVASFSPSATKSLYYDFTIKLVSYIRAIMNFRVVSSLNNDKLLDPEDFLQTFEEELYNAHFGKNDGFPGLPTYEELVDAVRMFRADPNGIAYRVETSRLVGYAAKHRFLEVFGVILLIQDMELLTMDQILSAGLPAFTGKFNSVDFKLVLHKYLQDNVLRLNNVVPWLCNHLEHLLYHHFDDAVRLLLETPEFKVLKTHQHFIQRMTDGFRALADERIEDVRRSVVSLIRDYSEVMSLDIAYRNVVTLALAPMGHEPSAPVLPPLASASSAGSTPTSSPSPASAMGFNSWVYKSVQALFSGPLDFISGTAVASNAVYGATGTILSNIRSHRSDYDIQDLLNSGNYFEGRDIS